MQPGSHLALDDEQASAVLAAAGDDPALGSLLTDLADAGVPTYADGDAWDPVTSALAPASDPVDRDPDEWPAYGVILGDYDLSDQPTEPLVTYLEPAHVAEVSAWLANVDEQLFAASYDAMPDELRNADYGDAQRDEAWTKLDGLRGFLQEAARGGKHVVFRVQP